MEKDKYIEYLEKRIADLNGHYRDAVAKEDFRCSAQMWARMNELQAMHNYFTRGAGK